MNIPPPTAVPEPQWFLGTSFRLNGPLQLEDVKLAGLDGIELTFHGLDIGLPEVRRQIEETAEASARLGLAVWSMHIPFGDDWDPSLIDEPKREQAAENVCGVIKLARELEIGTLVYHPSFEPVLPRERAARLDICRDTLAELGQEAHSSGIKLAIECLPRTCLGNTSAEIAQLIDDIPALGICCDVNHLLQEPPEHFIRRLGQRIVTTHISDNDGLDEKHWLPGLGTIAWRNVIAAFVESGYRGAFMYEVRDCDPFRIKENWERLIEAYFVRPQ